MKGSSLKWLLLGGVLMFLLLYGLEMSTAGIEKIYGPLEGSGLNDYTDGSSTVADTSDPERGGQESKKSKEVDEITARIADLEAKIEELRGLATQAGNEQEPYVIEQEYKQPPISMDYQPIIPLESEGPAIDRIANSTSGILQNASSEGIKKVVSLFDSLVK